MNTKYPNLDEFFGTYFHQDWPKDAPTAIGIVQKYLHEWPAEGVSAALSELRQMLADMPSEGDLVHAIRSLGCYYNPGADGLTYAAWLSQVRQLFEEAVA